MAFPPSGSPTFSAVNFKINTPTVQTRTLSGLTRRVGMGHSYYSFTAKFSNLTRYEAGPILGYVASLYGPLDPFLVYIPELSYSKTTNQTTGTVSTNEALTAGATSCAITSIANGKEFLRAGDFFCFVNHPKVYMCTETWTAGELKFSGSLVTDVPSGTSIIYGGPTSPVPFTCILENDVQQWDTGAGGIVNISLDMREVWNIDPLLS
jgi:hypothetical protein